MWRLGITASRPLVTFSLALGVVAFPGCERKETANVFGLTANDERLGGNVDAEVLRTSAEAVAGEHISDRDDVLRKFRGGPYTLSVDYSLAPLLAKLGYKSSFYYFCWDLYLPYRLKTSTGESFILIVQVSDRTEGNKRDNSKFRVLRTKIISEDGREQAGFGDEPR